MLHKDLPKNHLSYLKVSSCLPKDYLNYFRISYGLPKVPKGCLSYIRSI
jgi:hypothetical protein